MKNIEVRHLRAFVAVAEELNYRKAAQRLHVAQPALSRTIQQLEGEVGARLLDRSTTAVQLTEVGVFLLDRARTILSTLQQAADDVQRLALGQTGEVRVGFNDFAIADFLPPVIHRFRGSYPEVTVKLCDETSPRMLQMVLDGRLDIGFLSGISAPPELDTLLLREESFVALLPVDHPLARRGALQIADLAQQPFVMGDCAWSVFLQAVEAYCGQAGFKPQVVQTAVHSNGIVNFVAAGIGVSIYVDRDWLRQRNDVVVRPLPKPTANFQTLAVWRRAGRSAALNNLIEVMRAVLG